MDRLAVQGVRLLHQAKDEAGFRVLPNREMGARMTAIESWCERADDLVARGNRGTVKGDDGVTPGVDRACYLPTPEEIAAACERIRAEWSPEEEQSRRAKVVPWAVPTCRYRREMVE